MQPESLARLYNGGVSEGYLKPLYASLFDKHREQLVQISAGRALAGFQIELGEDRESDRNRLGLYDSSDRDQDWPEEARTRTRSSAASGEVYNGIRSEGSDNSEDFEEELDLEVDASGGLERPPELAQSGVEEAARFSPETVAKAGSVPPAEKFMYPVVNPFASAGSHPAGNGTAREQVASELVARSPLSDAVCFQTASRTSETFAERPQASEHSLRHFLSDPVSGALMEDAFILPCGDSVGVAGFQRVQETNVCVVCYRQVSVMSAAPNHALRTAVLAYKRERECGSTTRSTKRRRDQDHLDKPKGVQFPYNVSDRVLIKGNKRTPERFVGREAMITTQCLNGWYLVRTLDNGESVRLQYRSLEKL